MPIFQQGNLNTAGLIVPDLYVQIVPPQNLVVNGVPTNLIGVVGAASWGPVNQPVIVGTMADYVTALGNVVARKFDLGTQVATAIQQGASGFRCVRVTDGTDTAASYDIAFSGGTYAVKLTACYSGSLGNSIAVSLGSGSGAGTWRLTLALPGRVPEIFDNIQGATPAAIWQALVNLVNTGGGPLQAASQLVVATLGTATATPPSVITGQTLLGGTDGATGVTAATLVGQDNLPRTGMYALRGQGCSIGVLADADDPTQWTSQAAFGASEGVYMILTGPTRSCCVISQLSRRTHQDKPRPLPA